MGMKQVIVLRKDLNMRKGKMVAQGAHASMAAILRIGYSYDGFKDPVYIIPLKSPEFAEWLEGSFKKVCVGCQDEAELLALHEQAKQSGLSFALIRDSGLTEFNGVPTFTALAVGPGEDGEVDKITGHLKLL